MRKSVIYINGRFLGQRVTGVQRYAIQMLEHLDRLLSARRDVGEKLQFEVLVPRNVSPKVKFKHIPIRSVGLSTGHLWEQLELPWYSKRGFLVGFCNTGPMFKKRQMVTIHDASVYSFPEGYSFLFRSYYKMLFRQLSRRVPIILTDSNFSKGELLDYLKVSEDKIKVVYLGCDHVWVTADQGRKCPQKPFFMAVGSQNPNKNFSLILRALQEIPTNDFEVLIVGGVNSKVFRENQDSIPEDARIRYLSYVDDEELGSLYHSATGFIFPSLYEGFGLPPLEAMVLRCPVLVSKIPVLEEICSNAALYFDPRDPKDLADKINSLFSNPDLRESLVNAGLERVKSFQWEKSVQSFFETLEEVLKAEVALRDPMRC